MAATLSDAWPTITRYLRHDLRSFGMSAHDLEEVIQEVAVRALARGEPFPSTGELCAWSRVVGRNLAIAWYRQQPRRMRARPLAAEHASSIDVARLAEQRIALRAVDEVWQTLSAKDREAMAATLGGPSPTDARELAAWRLRRHRVRNRLLDIIGGVPGVVTGVWRAACDRVARVLHALDLRVLDHALGALSSTAGVLTMTALVGIATAPAVSDPSPTVRAVGIVTPVSEPSGPSTVGTPSPSTPPGTGQRPPASDPAQPAPLIGVQRERQQGPASGPGERWVVEPAPAHVDYPPPDASDEPTSFPVTMECPTPEQRTVYLAVACPLLEDGVQSGG